MFTPDEREEIRAAILARAQTDSRITGCAITGSASLGNEDRWSDIDLAFGVKADVQPALEDFSAFMYEAYDAVHHHDVPSGSWIYRVFFLPSTLQVDLAFAPEADFGARGPSFKLLFGKASDQPHPPLPQAEQLIGMAWLYALHVRSSIARGKVWQAEYMIHGMRDQVLALACLRSGLPVREGRGYDRLPNDVLITLEATLVRSLDPKELSRSFRATTEALIREIGLVDKSLASRLEPVLLELAESTSK